MTDMPRRRGSDSVPFGVRATAAWSWRLLLIGAALAACIFLIAQVRIVVIPLLLSLLLTSLLTPLVDLLQRHRWPRALAVALAVVGTVLVVAGVVTLISWQIARGVPDLVARGRGTLRELERWINSLPIDVTSSDLTHYAGTMFSSLKDDASGLVSGVLSVGSTAGHIVTGALLTLFSLIFMLFDGRGIFRWIVGIAPRNSREAISGACRRGWTTLTNYTHAQIMVAAIDALGIGIGAFCLGLPLVLPMSLLVFLCSFVPFVGAILSGALVCIVALLVKDLFWALVMLGIVIVVQQLESHVLQPFIMGTAVRVHPLGVVVAVAVGTLVAGIPGALFAVPLVAVANTMIGYLVRREWMPKSASAGRDGDPAGVKLQP